MRIHQVHDLPTLKALAHPLRVEALSHLRTHGPATASELGRALGESSGSLSYHLRQLERFGFITEIAAENGRERRWQAAHDVTNLPSALAATVEGRAALDVVKGRQRQHLLDGLQRADDDPGGPYEHSDYLVRLTPGDLKTMQAELRAVVEAYQDRPKERAADDAADVSSTHRLIAVHLVSVPEVGP